ncbi:hypothetical protein Ciccas_011129 [Cichlidogyrus casuarinus]|uniref:Uncharacterized protein n=1 Tax=Cichlidogyrus casuarinus TaxID=1844966 RepID=A0ABD2PTB8_9PLAT
MSLQLDEEVEDGAERIPIEILRVPVTEFESKTYRRASSATDISEEPERFSTGISILNADRLPRFLVVRNSVKLSPQSNLLLRRQPKMTVSRGVQCYGGDAHQPSLLIHKRCGTVTQEQPQLLTVPQRTSQLAPDTLPDKLVTNEAIKRMNSLVTRRLSIEQSVLNNLFLLQ